MARISQREAQRMRKRLRQLEDILERQTRAYAREWPGYIVIGHVPASEVTMAIVKTARSLKHAVVIVPGEGCLSLFASPLPGDR